MHLPNKCQWLAGEGAGSWFNLRIEDSQFRIIRYSPEGNIECSGIFAIKSGNWNPELEYNFTHLSHCQQVKIIQHNQTIIFERISD